MSCYVEYCRCGTRVANERSLHRFATGAEPESEGRHGYDIWSGVY